MQGKMSKMTVFSIFTDFDFLGNFTQIFAIFIQQKKYLKMILTLFLFKRVR